MNNIKLWFSIVGLVVGVITGGLGSAAVGSQMYNKLDGELTYHIDHQYKQDVETATRLARIEEIQKQQAAIQQRQMEVLEEIRDELRR